MATHSSILAQEIPWTEEPGSLYSPRGCKELDTTSQLIRKYRLSPNNDIPCVLKYIHIAYPFDTLKYISINPIPLICPSLLFISPLLTTNLFSMSVSLFLFYVYIHLVVLFNSFGFHMEVIQYLSLTDFTKHNTFQLHPHCCKWQDFILFYS